MIELLLVATVFAVAVRLGMGFRKPESSECRESDVYDGTYSEISEKIDQLNRYKHDIDEINEMINDIHSCSPGEVLKTVQIKILESGREYNLLIDGEDNSSEYLLDILNIKRDDLAYSLRQAVKEIA